MFVDEVILELQKRNMNHLTFGNSFFGEDGGRIWRRIRDPLSQGKPRRLTMGEAYGISPYKRLYREAKNAYFARRRFLMSAKSFCIPLAMASREIGVSVVTMRRYCKEGRIEARKTPGGQWRVSLRSLDLYQPGKKRVDEICRIFEK